MFNSAEGFYKPGNLESISQNYLYLGFLNQTYGNIIGSIQGWRADGTDITFTNCDGHGLSFFSFYPTLSYSGTSFGLGSNYQITNTWRSGVNGLDALDSVSLVSIALCNVI